MGAGLTWKSQHNYTCNSVAPSHQNLPGWHRFCPIRNPLDGSNVSIIIVGQGILDKDLLLLSLTFVGAGAQAQETAVFIMRTAP